MPNENQQTVTESTRVLDEIFMQPSNEVINDRFNPEKTAHAPCGIACGAGCGGGCGGSATA